MNEAGELRSSHHETLKQAAGWDDDAFYAYISADGQHKAGRKKRKREAALRPLSSSTSTTKTKKITYAQCDVLTKPSMQSYIAATPSLAARHIRQLAMVLGSNIAAPLYLYASLKGKHDLWDNLLSNQPDSAFRGPALDIGCGEGWCC